MFDSLNTWWSGAISAISGIAVVFGLMRVVGDYRFALLYDTFSQTFRGEKLPKGFSAVFKLNEREVNEIFVLNAIFKNETNEAITDQSFAAAPKLRIQEEGELISYRIVDSGPRVRTRSGS